MTTKTLNEKLLFPGYIFLNIIIFKNKVKISLQWAILVYFFIFLTVIIFYVNYATVILV